MSATQEGQLRFILLDLVNLKYLNDLPSTYEEDEISQIRDMIHALSRDTIRDKLNFFMMEQALIEKSPLVAPLLEAILEEDRQAILSLMIRIALALPCNRIHVWMIRELGHRVSEISGKHEFGFDLFQILIRKMSTSQEDQNDFSSFQRWFESVLLQKEQEVDLDLEIIRSEINHIHIDIKKLQERSSPEKNGRCLSYLSIIVFFLPVAICLLHFLIAALH